jgi:hypothetical protein
MTTEFKLPRLTRDTTGTVIEATRVERNRKIGLCRELQRKDKISTIKILDQILGRSIDTPQWSFDK